MVAVDIDTGTGYLWISLIEAVSVQASMLLSHPYEVTDRIYINLIYAGQNAHSTLQVTH